MRKELIVLALLGILLAGCGGEKAPAKTPTSIPTKTIVPTATPTSTLEPTATPTPTPLPTPTPEPLPPLTSLGEIDIDDDPSDLDLLRQLELNEFNSGYYRWAIGIANVIIEKWLGDYPNMYILRAEAYDMIGDQEAAIRDWETALEKTGLEDPSEYISANNNLCWTLVLRDEPETALPYCEQAVALFFEMPPPEEFSPEAFLAPMKEASYLDSRGLAYGMLGRTKEAIADFERVLELAEEDPVTPPEIWEQRAAWLDVLKQGENPFTPETLAKLKEEELISYSEAYPEPDYRDDFSYEYFTQVMQNDGFDLLNSEKNHEGGGVDTYLTVAGECVIGMGLFQSNAGGLGRARMLLMECEEIQYQAEARWLVKLLLFEDPRADIDSIELGEWYAWEQRVLMDIVDGTIPGAKIEIGGIQFNVTREEEEDGSFMIIIDAT